jgi:hypothetical protein
MASIALRIPSVRCVDETGGSFAERFGNDEIYIGAVYVIINANKSFTVGSTGAKLVGNNFDDNETVNWNRDLFNLSLGSPAVDPYPKAVLASIMLAEHDAGNGRNTFLEKLAEEFRKKLTAQAIEGAIRARVSVGGGGSGVALAPAAGFIVDVLKDFAKEKLKEVGNFLIDQIGSWVGDDIFPTTVKLIDLSNENQTWDGQPRTPDETIEFRGHKGLYTAVMHWERR